MPDWWYEETSKFLRQGFRVERVHEEETGYQHLVVWRHPRLGHILTLDGIVQTAEGDEWVYHEILTQVPLSGLARPVGSVLIIGGGDGGTLRQVLLHDSVRRATLVEIDAAVVAAARKYLAFSTALSDPRAEIVYEDGAAFVQSASARKDPYDVVLVDSTDPEGPGTVLFTPEFTRGVRDLLSPDGVMVRQAGVPMYEPETLRKAAPEVRAVFGSCQVYRAPVPTYIGGDMAFVLAAKNGAPFDRPAREFTGRFYNPDVHRASFALPTWWRDLVG